MEIKPAGFLLLVVAMSLGANPVRGRAADELDIKLLLSALKKPEVASRQFAAEVICELYNDGRETSPRRYPVKFCRCDF